MSWCRSLLFVAHVSLIFLFAMGSGPSCSEDSGRGSENEVPTYDETHEDADGTSNVAELTSLVLSTTASGPSDCPVSPDYCYSNYAGRCAQAPFSPGICRLGSGYCGSCGDTTAVPIAAPTAPSNPTSTPSPTQYVEYINDSSCTGTLTWNNGGPSMMMMAPLTLVMVPTLQLSGTTAPLPPLAVAILTVGTAATVIYFIVVLAEHSRYYAAYDQTLVNNPYDTKTRLLERVRIIPAPTAPTPSKTPATPKPRGRVECTMQCAMYAIGTWSLCHLFPEPLTWGFELLEGEDSCSKLQNKLLNEVYPSMYNSSSYPGCRMYCPGKCSCQAMGGARW